MYYLTGQEADNDLDLVGIFRGPQKPLAFFKTHEFPGLGDTTHAKYPGRVIIS